MPNSHALIRPLLDHFNAVYTLASRHHGTSMVDKQEVLRRALFCKSRFFLSTAKVITCVCSGEKIWLRFFQLDHLISRNRPCQHYNIVEHVDQLKCLAEILSREYLHLELPTDTDDHNHPYGYN